MTVSVSLITELCVCVEESYTSNDVNSFNAKQIVNTESDIFYTTLSVVAIMLETDGKYNSY